MEKNKVERNIQKLAIQFIENKNEKNFNLLANRINWGLRGYIFKIVHDNSAVDEIVSKTLENIYFKCEQFDPNRASFSTWMYRIARNNSLKYLQEHEKFQNVLCSEDMSCIYDSELPRSAASGDDGDSGCEFIDIWFTGNIPETYDKERMLNEIYDASVKCIQLLPDNLRIVIHERFINSKKIEDIAYDNNIPLSSVKNWLRKGRGVLKETMKEKYAMLYNMYSNE